MASAGVLNPSAKDQEANYGKMVAVGPPTLDNAILLRNIRLTVHKLTTNPPRTVSPQALRQEVVVAKELSPKAVPLTATSFSYEATTSEQHMPSTSHNPVTTTAGTNFRIRNDRSLIELAKKVERPNTGTKPLEVNSPSTGGLRRSRHLPEPKPATKTAEQMGLLYTIHEDKQKLANQAGMIEPKRSISGRNLVGKSPVSRSVIKDSIFNDNSNDQPRSALWLKYRHGAFKPKKLDDDRDRQQGSSSTDVGDRSHRESESRGHSARRIGERPQQGRSARGERVPSLTKMKMPHVSPVKATPRSARGDNDSNLPVSGKVNAVPSQSSKQTIPLLRIQSVQQAVRVKPDFPELVEKKPQAKRPVTSNKFFQLENQSKSKHDEPSKNKSQLVGRLSPAVGRKLGGLLGASQSVAGEDKKSELKEGVISNRLTRPMTRAATVHQIVSRSSGFSKIKKSSLPFDKPKWEHERNRKFPPEHALLNLMYGLIVRAKMGGGSTDAQIRYNICAGNNGSLVEGMIRNKPLTVHENMFHKSQIQWSQTQHKNLAPSAVAGIPKIPFRELGNLDDYKEFPLGDPTKLVEILTGHNLFKVDLKKVKLVEVFSSILKSNNIACSLTGHLHACNHLQGVTSIAHKTKLTETIMKFAKLRKVDPFTIIPKTWMIRLRTAEHDIERILTARKGIDWKREPVIVKPGENTNRGVGITMGYSPEEAFQSALSLLRSQKGVHCIIIQSYITNPLLYKKRKFDIRCYGLVVKYGGRTFYFWYGDGYARTSSYEFTVDCKHNLMVHLTNEAVQVKGNLTLNKIPEYSELSNLATKCISTN